MKITEVLLAKGCAGHFHIDAAALRAGAVADGFSWKGAPRTPGFSRIVQPAESLSIMLRLEDGQIGFGDCVDVAYAGSAGREGPFAPDRVLPWLGTELRDRLVGTDALGWRGLAESFDAARENGEPWPVAIRYGLGQALLHAASLARRQPMARLICAEYNLPDPRETPLLLACAAMDDHEALDRLILKRVDVLPHSFITDPDRHLGRAGEALLGHIRRMAARIQALGEPDYHPTLQFDMSGNLGRLFRAPDAHLLDFLERLADAAAPFALRIECPWLAASRQEQIEVYVELTAAMRRRGRSLRIGVDEWCNRLEDFAAFAAAGAGDYLHIKMPDLGCITGSMSAISACRVHGMAFCLGGSANETDQSARVSSHIGLAFRPEVMLAKPGLGGDEGLMIVRNEMARALAISEHGGGQRQPASEFPGHGPFARPA
ncbi:methylaspartate ammonia-lyase [Bosea caraganae]|uniref:methylaspartate ammonia-lyase n=1 Tax=Bosea caraganae TaxID=2763117 RepID=A0A370L5F3_9HYPH|nr:methylaspartate ammonia-lyase [Bosea caraganae]RDJ23375.1 methylaspartate ammonia-lyase [Bosea caraganae]RDJ24512.1 methylaspartate ammonia-lyase [Bosea caraganae]